MRTPAPLSLTVLLMLAGACATTPALPPGERVGERMAGGEILPLAVVDARPVDFYERTLLVEATVTAVCQNAGCWMKVEDGGRVAMVRWETGCGGKYAFPADAAGRRVVIQGSYYAKQISEEDARHLEQEAGPGIEIPRETHELNASAVLVLDAPR